MSESLSRPYRFKSTVAWYERYRLAYPERLIARVAGLAGLEPGDPVLDLGTGTGMLAVPFARLGLAVTAMDPEPAMLTAAREGAAAAKVTVDIREGGSGDLTPDMGPYRLVTMGRSFHWMDCAATLAMLDHIIAPGGGVALFHDAHPPVEENRWFKTLYDVARKFGRNEKAHVKERDGGHRRYEPFLFDSAFTVLDGLSVTQRRPIAEDEIVGRAFSLSTSSPERLGARIAAFEADLRASLRALASDGNFMEVAELVCVLARRPAGRANGGSNG